MKTLSILRHGKSSWENLNLDDIDRPLLRKGIMRTQKVCNYMKNKDIIPDCIITSPAKRAMETAHIVIEELNLSLLPQINKGFYPGSIREIMGKISEMENQFEHLMVVGHNPVLTDLVMHLSKNLNIEWLPTSGLVSLEFKMLNWKSVTESKGKCIHYAKPNDL